MQSRQKGLSVTRKNKEGVKDAREKDNMIHLEGCIGHLAAAETDKVKGEAGALEQELNL